MPHGVMPLTSIVQSFVDRLFQGLRCVRCTSSVSRNSDLFVDDEEVTDLRAALQGGWSSASTATKSFEVSAGISDALVAPAARVRPGGAGLHASTGRSTWCGCSSSSTVDLPELKYPPFEPSVPAVLRGKTSSPRSASDIWSTIRTSRSRR